MVRTKRSRKKKAVNNNHKSAKKAKNCATSRQRQKSEVPAIDDDASESQDPIIPRAPKPAEMTQIKEKDCVVQSAKADEKEWNTKALSSIMEKGDMMPKAEFADSIELSHKTVRNNNNTNENKSKRRKLSTQSLKIKMEDTRSEEEEKHHHPRKRPRQKETVHRNDEKSVKKSKNNLNSTSQQPREKPSDDDDDDNDDNDDNSKYAKPPTKTHRTNWAVGENAARLTQAVQDWDAKSPSTRKENGEPMSKKEFAEKVKIPHETFRKYTGNDKCKRRKLGVSTGAKPLLDEDQSEMIKNAIMHAANDGKGGMARQHVIELIQDVASHLTLKQVENYYQRTLFLQHPELAKPRNTYVSKRPRSGTKGEGTRTNWSKGEAADRLTKAVEDWDAKAPSTFKENGKRMSKQEFARSVGLPPPTFSKYVQDDKSKRRELGKGAGRRPLLSAEQYDLIAETVRREGKSRQDALKLIQSMAPHLSLKQVETYYQRICIGQNMDSERKKPIKDAFSENLKKSDVQIDEEKEDGTGVLQHDIVPPTITVYSDISSNENSLDPPIEPAQANELTANDTTFSPSDTPAVAAATSKVQNDLIIDGPPSKPTKATRTNWAIGENAARLAKAVEDWDAQAASTMDKNGKPMSKREFAQSLEIPYDTFRKYAYDDKSKRRKLGKSSGRKPLLDADQADLIAKVLEHSVEGEQGGLSRQDTIRLIQDVAPDVTRMQAENYYHRTLFEHYPELHKRIVDSWIERKTK